MIIDGILFLIYGVVFVVTAPFRLFSDVSQPAFFNSTITTANGYLSTGYTWLPYMVNTLLLTWGLFVALEIVIFSYKGVMWLIKKIPGFN